jgi:hypothetical protein
MILDATALGGGGLWCLEAAAGSAILTAATIPDRAGSIADLALARPGEATAQE